MTATPARAEPDPAELLRQARQPSLDLAGAVSLREVELALGPGRFLVDRGVLFPARLEDGRAVEFVFVGQARFVLSAPDEIEAGQIELFTGDRRLDAPVEEAVLSLPPGGPGEALLARPPPRDVRPELADRARDIYAAWIEGAQREHAGVAATTVAGLVGDRAYADYFTLWCRSYELGTFVFQLDPDDPEPITLASFHPLGTAGWDRQRMKRQIRLQQRKGRWLGIRYRDLGAWDVWMSSTMPARDAREHGRGFEAEHYELDVTVERRGRRLAGRGRVHLIAQEDGRRFVRLQLMRNLVVRSVVDAEDRELFFFRSGDEVMVLLPEPSVGGRRQVLTIDYDGHALEWVGRRTWDLLDTSDWHPHCGEVDRATYDVTLRWPRKHDLVASGKLVASGREGRYAWERRRVDLPSMAFSFAIGRYLVERRQAGHVNLEVAFDRNLDLRLTTELRKDVLDRIADALEYYEEAFGPYPLDELKVVTVSRNYSQSYLGFIALSNRTLQYVTPQGDAWVRDLVMAHELAHQWWGNLVGWRSYRDQWLSEGMANYAALLYSSRHEGKGDLLGVMSAGWRRFLSQNTPDGRTLESLGPVVLGVRLNSTRAQNGYRTIVYRKGAVVLAMLARAVGEERFLEILQGVVAERSRDVLTTENFLDAFTEQSEMDMDGFADQYVFGTGIPHVYYDYRVDPRDDERWVVRGEVRMLARSRSRHVVVDLGDGRWDVTRRTEGPAAGPTTLMVPYRVTADGPALDAAADDDVEPWSKERARAAAQREGRMFVRGRQDVFVLETQWKPRDLQLDPAGEILAWFHSADRTPRAFRIDRAEDLAHQGRHGEAEAEYREALALPPDPPEGREHDVALALGGRLTGPDLEGVRIRFALAELCLDQGREEDAESWLDEVEEALGDHDPTYRLEREVLASRAEVRRGEAERVYRRLGKTLRLAYPEGPDTTASRLWRSRFGTSGVALTDAFALYAVAAAEVGDTENADWARREAARRGADVSALERSEAFAR